MICKVLDYFTEESQCYLAKGRSVDWSHLVLGTEVHVVEVNRIPVLFQCPPPQPPPTSVYRRPPPDGSARPSRAEWPGWSDAWSWGTQSGGANTPADLTPGSVPCLRPPGDLQTLQVCWVALGGGPGRSQGRTPAGWRRADTARRSGGPPGHSPGQRSPPRLSPDSCPEGRGPPSCAWAGGELAPGLEADLPVC